ncbi:MAG: glutamine synthetase [Rhodospirillaceae bacterium]|nr:glutamine synthetase [Rhodospirillaceae bacterium]
MTPSEVQSAEDMRRIVEERGAKNVTIAMSDMHGLLRGKYISRDKLNSVLENGWGMPPLILALDFDDIIMEATEDLDGSDGYADVMARALPETCREIPWESPERNLLMLAEFAGDMEALCPRGIYRRIAQKAADMGFQPYHACELEFTMFDETALSAHDKGYQNLDISTPLKTYEVIQRQAVWTEFYNELLDCFDTMGVALETAHEEMGPGFLEVSLAPQSGVEAADNAVLFKTYTKALAQRMGRLVTFMARWSNEADGQSGHVHISLKDKDGQPVFRDDTKDDSMSDTMRHFLGGMQALMPELLIMMGPNLNSFKRFVPGIFSPIAATWGYENRTCALRVIRGAAKSQRIECRTPGADANPYLSLACLLGSGLYGIEHEIEPTAPMAGNVYDQEIPEGQHFPDSFRAGIDRFRASKAARELFGERFVEAYATTRASQDREFRAVVTDAELRRFFELA